MKVIAYDPFLSPERAQELGVEKVELRRADPPRRFHHACTRRSPTRPRTSWMRRPRRNEEGGAHHQLCPRRAGGRRGFARRARSAAMSPGPPSTCSPRSRPPENRAVRASQCGVHAASRCRHRRGAGKRRLADRRADVGLSSARRDLECGEFSLHQRRRGAAAASPSSSLRKSSAPLPANSTETGIKTVRLSYEGDVPGMNTKALDLGGHCRAAAAHAAGGQCGVRAGHCQGARHRHRGDDARGRGRLRKPDHGQP